MIKLLRYTNVLNQLVIIGMVIWGLLTNSEFDIYQFVTLALVLVFVMDLITIYFLKRKRDNNEIHLFYNRNKEASFATWVIIGIAAFVLFFVIIDSTETMGWFWLAVLVIKGIDYFFKISQWDALIEENNLHEKSFWMKAIPISEIINVNINDQGHLEITTAKSMTLFKLDSGISVNLRDKIEAIQSATANSYA